MRTRKMVIKRERERKEGREAARALSSSDSRNPHLGGLRASWEDGKSRFLGSHRCPHPETLHPVGWMQQLWFPLGQMGVKEETGQETR